MRAGAAVLVRPSVAGARALSFSLCLFLSSRGTICGGAPDLMIHVRAAALRQGASRPINVEAAPHAPRQGRDWPRPLHPQQRPLPQLQQRRHRGARERAGGAI